jgi:tRNA A-37 threonylcarbamoyl transferase component Bud32
MSSYRNRSYYEPGYIPDRTFPRIGQKPKQIYRRKHSRSPGVGSYFSDEDSDSDEKIDINRPQFQPYLLPQPSPQPINVQPIPTMPEPEETKTPERIMSIPERGNIPERINIIKQRDEIIGKYGRNIITCAGEYEIGDLIHSGAFGSAYTLYDKYYASDKVMKIIKFFKKNSREYFLHEVRMQKIFSRYNLAPVVHDMCIFTDYDTTYGTIIMDKVEGTLDSLLVNMVSTQLLNSIIDSLYELLNLLCEYDLTHGDFHVGNIGYKLDINGDIKLILIDFGYSCCIKAYKCDTQLELAQLIRSIYTSSAREMYTGNKNYILRILVNRYKNTYSVNKNITAKNIMDEYVDIVKSHIKSVEYDFN